MIGWAEGDQQEPPEKKERERDNPRPQNKPRNLSNRNGLEGEHTRPQSGQDPAVIPSSRRLYLHYWVLPTRCSVGVSVLEHWVVQCFGLYSTGKFWSSNNFFSLTTLLQSQSVHKAASLQPEKLERTIRTKPVIKPVTDEHSKKVARKQTPPHFSLKMESFLSSASKKQCIFISSCQTTTEKKILCY